MASARNLRPLFHCQFSTSYSRKSMGGKENHDRREEEDDDDDYDYYDDELV